jgi:hypothetical protein
MTKHTPGPWFYNQDEGGFQGHNVNVADQVIADIPDDNPNAAHDARLIAAAPDLLEELKTLVAGAQHYALDWDLTAALAAIAKAEGAR